MKRIMLVGKTSAGKTTLCQALREDSLEYHKTQSVVFADDAIDTPGEYLENRSLYRALMVTAAEAEAILLVQDVTDPDPMFPPGFAGMFGGKPVLGAVTKLDLTADPRAVGRAGAALTQAGADPVIPISAVTGRGISDLRQALENNPREPEPPHPGT